MKKLIYREQHHKVNVTLPRSTKRNSSGFLWDSPCSYILINRNPQAFDRIKARESQRFRVAKFCPRPRADTSAHTPRQTNVPSRAKSENPQPRIIEFTARYRMLKFPWPPDRLVRACYSLFSLLSYAYTESSFIIANPRFRRVFLC